MKPEIFFIIVALAVGCGPLATPMVDRPSADDQKSLDDSWNRALSPTDKLTRQEWLDLFVGAQAYQAGVDKLHMRSEKAFSDGTIVMEVHYDRFSPEVDLFEVSVLDTTGQILRKEQYTRQDVEKTRSDLFEKVRPADDEERAEFEAELKARWEKIAEYFPNANQDETN
jgi:hypothetical protein